MKRKLRILKGAYHLTIMKICYALSLVLFKLHTGLANTTRRHHEAMEKF